MKKRLLGIRRKYPGCIGCPGLILLLFCLANTPHWIEVLLGQYPLFYCFPEHSFTVVDADTKKPVEGVVAVYLYHSLSMYGGEWDFSPLLDFAGRGIYAVFIHIANPMRHENIDWNGRGYIAYLAEGVSDAHGKITFPPSGPFQRRRNNYFHQGGAPVGYLLKDGYAVKTLTYNIGARTTGWRSVPVWEGTTIPLQAIDAFAKQKQEDFESDIYRNCFEEYYGPSSKTMIPQTYKYLLSRMEWYRADSDAAVEAIRAPHGYPSEAEHQGQP